MKKLFFLLINLLLVSCIADFKGNNVNVTYTQYISPSNYPDLIFWIKSEDLSSLSSGAAIQTWKNRGSLGGNVIQGVSSKAPTKVSSSVNGFSSAYFSGSKSMVFPGVFPVTGNKSHTFFVLINNFTNDTNNYQQIIFAYGGNATVSASWYVFSGGMARTTDTGLEFNNLSISTATPFQTSPTLIAFRYNGTTGKYYINKVLEKTKSLPLVTGIDYPLTFGKHTQFDVYWGNFELVEMVYYDRDISDNEFNNISDYFYEKYNL